MAFLRRITALLSFILLATVSGDAVMTKQDVTVELFYSGVWNDHTERARTRGQIVINHGAGTEQIGVIGSDASLTFDNRDGEMNPDNVKSSLYGLIGFGTQIRITVGTDIRFVGRVVSWKPRRALGKLDVATGRGDAWVNIKAQSEVGRLGQGDQPKLKSALQRFIVMSTPPVAYWALDSGELATAGQATIGLYPFNIASGNARFSGTAIATWLDPGVSIESAGTIEGDVSMTKTPAQITVDHVRRQTTSSRDLDLRIQGNTVNASSERIDWLISSNAATSQIELYVEFVGVSSSSSILLDTITSATFDDKAHHFRWIAQQSGADVLWSLSIDGVGVSGGTQSSMTLQGVSRVSAVSAAGTGTGTGFSHVTVWSGTPTVLDSTYQAFTGYLGETAGNRFKFLCIEEGIDWTIVGDIDQTQKMGPQYPDTFLKILEEIAKTDAGIIYDTRTEIGLTLRTGRSLNNQTPLTLDFDQGHIGDPLEPDIDQLGRSNTVTAKRRDGDDFTAVETGGPLGTTTISAFPSQVDVNPDSDADVEQHAYYHLALATDPSPRYQQITVDLDANPGLVSTVSALDIGDLLSMENIPDVLGQADADTLILGYTEPVGTHRRVIDFNTRRGKVLQQIGVYGTASTVSRYDSANSSLSAGVTAAAVSLSVATDAGHALWITGSSSPTFPFDIGIDGEQITVSAISGASSPQTFTVIRGVNGAAKSHSSGADVRLWTPARYAL